MASTYTVNLGIEKIGTGEQSGTWGTTTNTNFDLIDQAINGAVTVTLASAGTSGSPNTLAITDGAVSDGRNKFIDFADGGDLGAAAYIQLTPNDAEKLVHIRNSLSGGRSIFVFQGTYNASNDFEIPNGKDVVLKFDGGGATATVTQVFEDLLVTAVAATTVDTTNIEVTNLKAKDGTSAGSIADSTGVVTLASSVLTTTDINGGSVDGVTLGTNSAVTEAQIDNININGNTISSTDTNGNVTITPDGTGSVAISKIDVAGGEIDGTAIGANSASTAVFTDLTASGTVSFSGATVSDGGTVTTIDINGGNIDGTIIGAATPAAGSFTTGQFGTSLNVDGTVTADGLTVDSSSGITVNGPTNQDGKLNLVAYAGVQDAEARIQAARGNTSGTDSRLQFLTNNGTSLLTRVDINDNGDISFYEPTGTNTRIVYDADAEFVINEDSADFDFRVETDGATHMLFVDGGNNRVGINTNSPTATFHSVSASTNMAKFEGSFSGDAAYVSFLNNATSATGNGAGLEFRAHTTTNERQQAFILTGWVDNTDATRTSNFVVNQTIAGAGREIIDSTGDAGMVINQSGIDYDFRVESDTNTHMLFVDAGNDRVGINNSSPNTTFHVVGPNQSGYGTMTIEGNADEVDPRLSFYGFSTTAGTTRSYVLDVFGDVSEKGARYDVPSGYYQAWSIAGTKKMSLASSGYLGINELSPDYHLHVNSGTTNVVAKFESTDSTSVIQFVDSGGNSEFGTSGSTARISPNGSYAVIEASQSSVVLNNAAQDTDFRVESDSNTHMLFVDAGADKVAINTSSPQQLLHLSSSAITYMRATGGSGNTGIDFGQHSNASGYIWHRDDAAVIIGTNETERVRFGSSTAGETVFNEGGSDFDFRVESDTNTHMLFVDAGNDRVGINQSSPDQALHVGGAVKIDGSTASGVSLIREVSGYEYEYFFRSGLMASGETAQLTFTCGGIRRSAVIEITISGSYTASNTATNHPAAKYIMRVLTNDSGASSIDGPTAIYEYAFDSATDFTFTSLGSSQYRIDLDNTLASSNVDYSYTVKILNAASSGHTLTSVAIV